KKYCTTPACVKAAATILNSLDQSVDPCEDFYQYACGGWMKTNRLPENAVMLSKMSMLGEDNRRILRYVLEDESFELKGEAEKKARMLYRSCMNTTIIEKRGGQPLLNLLKKMGLEKVVTFIKIGFSGALGKQHRFPNTILSAYLEFMTKVGVLLGGEEYATRLQMQDVLEFEMKLAEMQLTAEEQSEHDKVYRKLTVSQLQKVAPFINWSHYFNSAFMKVDREIYSSEPVMVLSLDYLKKLSELVTQYLSNAQGRVTVANYLGWILVHSKLSKLSQPLRDAGDDLSKAIKGGCHVCERNIPADSKIMAQNIIQEIKESFKDNLPSLKWMDPETRILAAEKVDSMIETIGYPDVIVYPDELDESYEGLEFNETDYFQNVMNRIHFDTVSMLENLDTSTDRTGWSKNPTVINAFYDVTANLIAVTAAILQPPIYDASFPKSFNYGSIGVIMAHELTHGFDNTGSLYNQYGNLEQWWKNSTIKNFLEQAQCFVEQYSNYEVQGIRVIGTLSNSKDFAREFKCPFQSSMNPEKKCEVW
ncbi:endothelin-converting enzyme homolog, partial [Trichonephila inaurata madagascariensis]